MENIFDYLDGIENILGQLVINPIPANVQIMRTVYNTLNQIKADLRSIQQKSEETSEPCPEVKAEPVEENKNE